MEQTTRKTTFKLWIMSIILPLTGSGVYAQQVADNALQKVNTERAFYETLGKIYPPDSAVTLTKTSIAGVQSYWFDQKLLGQKKIIIYLHGGMYALGNIHSYKAMVSHLSKALNTAILFVEYSLAPEKPFPAANNEILRVYTELKKKYPDHAISVMGDSAGGGLSISLVNGIITSGLPLPHSLVLISPWVNLKCDNSSYTTKQSVDPILNKQILYEHALWYAAGHLEEADPSELTFTSFPPVFVLVGSDEVLYDDAVNFYKTIKSVQKQSKLKEYAGQKHVWPVTDIHSKASLGAIHDIREFISANQPDQLQDPTNINNQTMENKVNITRENQGNHISLVGDTYRIAISGKQTKGEYAVIDMLVPPGGGPPPHSHASIHESFYIIDGEIEFTTEDGKFIVKKGDMVTIPKGGAIHCFKNISKEMAHMVCTVVPAGLDEFFEEVGTPVKAGEFLPPVHLDQESIEKAIEISRKYGQVLYPPNYLDK